MAIALWRQTDSGQSGRILSVLLIILAYKLFEGGVTYSSLYRVIPHSLDWLPGAVLLIGPVFFGYMRLVAADNAFTAKQWLLHLTPAILLMIVNSPQLFISAAEKVNNIAQFQAYEGHILLPWRIIALLIIIKLHLAVYLASSWQTIIKFEQHANELRADNSQLILSRHKQLCLALIALEALWVVLFLFYQVGDIFVLDYVSKAWLLFIAVIILAMGYYGLKQPSILFSEVERDIVLSTDNMISDTSKEQEKQETDSKYVQSIIPESAAQEIASMIDQAITKEKLYLDDKLTLTSLASTLELKPHLVSQVINQHMETNFYKLINRYRVQEAIALLTKKDTGWSLERIAFESGFGNRVTFNSAFKAMQGCSPSVYRKNLKMAV